MTSSARWNLKGSHHYSVALGVPVLPYALLLLRDVIVVYCADFICLAKSHRQLAALQRHGGLYAGLCNAAAPEMLSLFMP